MRPQASKGRSSRIRAVRVLFAVLAGSALALAAVVSLAPFAAATDTTPKVTICHRTNSVTNPYVVITVDVSAADGVDGNSPGDDHSHHLGSVFDPNATYPPPHNGDQWGDIIPPPGSPLNWNTEGQALWNNDCNISSPTATATATFTATPTAEFTATATAEFTATPTATFTATPTPTATFTATATATAEFTATPTATFTATATAEFTATPTATFTGTATAAVPGTSAATPTGTPTAASPTPTATAVLPTNTLAITPANTPEGAVLAAEATPRPSAAVLPSTGNGTVAGGRALAPVAFGIGIGSAGLIALEIARRVKQRRTS